jgi:hypothetical protein
VSLLQDVTLSLVFAVIAALIVERWLKRRNMDKVRMPKPPFNKGFKFSVELEKKQ